MKIIDLFEETYLALTANKWRSGLTMLGIIIGIGSVISMVAIGQGSQDTIKSNIQSLGSNLIMVMPGMQRGAGTQVSQGRGSATTLTLEDMTAIEQEVDSIKAVAPEVSGRYQVTTKGANTNTSVVGTNANYLEIKSFEIDQGNFISQQQIDSKAKVAVIGPTVNEDLFGEGADPIGKTIRIKNLEFKIIGLTKAKGGTGFNNQDDIIIVPVSTAQQYFSGSNKISQIDIQAIDEESMTTVQEDVTELLLTRHNITDSTAADFSVMNQSDIVSAASSVAKTFTTLLGSVAAISLIVGGIGIMNMMLTTVNERTREIGLRKAIGAKRHDINAQFLTETITLTFIGGILGIILGWLASWLIYKLADTAANVSLESVILAFGVSAAIGIVFGYYPAKRASSLNPIEALRYE